MSHLDQFTWPISRLAEVIEALARKSGLPVHSVDLRQRTDANSESMVATASSLGLELETVEMIYGVVERQIPRLGPALLMLPGKEERRCLALLRSSRKAVVLAPDLTVRRLRVESGSAMSLKLRCCQRSIDCSRMLVFPSDSRSGRGVPSCASGWARLGLQAAG